MTGQPVEMGGVRGESRGDTAFCSRPTQTLEQTFPVDFSASVQGRLTLTASEKLFLFREYLASESPSVDGGPNAAQSLVASPGWQPVMRVWESDLQQKQRQMERPVSLVKSFAHLANEYGVEGLAELLPDNTPPQSYVVLTRIGSALDDIHRQGLRISAKSLPEFAEEITDFLNKAGGSERVGDDNRVTPEELESLQTMVARMAALEALRTKVVTPIIAAIREEGGSFALANDGRATLFEPDVWKDCPSVTLVTPDTAERSVVAVTAFADETVSDKTEKVLEYLLAQTFAQNPDAAFSAEAEARLRDTISTHLTAGTPLPISMYLSLEKFPNPFDTLNAGVDLAEVAFVEQIQRHLGEIERVAGMKPTLHILNESAMSDCWHGVSADSYKEGLGQILAAYNLQGQVAISNFNQQYLIDRLVTQDPAHFGGEVGGYRAFEFVHNAHQAMMAAMHALPGKEGLNALKGKAICGDSEVAERVLAYVADRRKAVLHDVQQGLNSELAHSVDPQILFPLPIGAGLYSDIVSHSKDTPLAGAAAQVGRDSLRGLAVDQAREQAITFKAIMHLRGFIEQETGVSMLPTDTIRESITGAEGKLSWNAGRTPHLTTAVLGHQGAPYAPHATGVLTSTGEIAVTHAHELLHEDAVAGTPNSRIQSRWQPVTVRVGSLSIAAFMEQPSGAPN